MAKGTKKKITQQADGKAETKEIRSLDDILGSKRSRYAQATEEDYKKFLKGLNLTDMQAHAIKVGLIPISDRKVLESRLIREYKKYKTNTPPVFNTLDESQPNIQKALDILSSGR